MRLALALVATFFVLFVFGLVVSAIRLHDPARPEMATGLAALSLATLHDPRFWVVTVVACGLVYWLSKR